MLPAAQAIPNVINIQGKLTDAQYNAQSGTHNFTFTIYNALTGGNARYSENISLNMTQGLWSHQLGSNNTIALGFTEDYYVEVAVDGQTLAPRLRLSSVGYAYRANQTDIVANNATILGNVTYPVRINITNATGSVVAYIDQSGNLNLTVGSYLGNGSGLTGVATTVNNVSLKYGWNGTVWSPLLTTGDGTLRLSVYQSGTNNVTDGGNASGNFTVTNNLIVSRNVTAGSGALFVGSANTRVGINTTSPSGILQVSVNGTAAAFFINETGNIGIGTASPAQTLTVAGTGNFTSTLWAGSTITGINGLTISAGTISLPASSISQNTLAGISGIPQANLTGLTIPAANVSAGTFASGLFTFQNNLTVAQNLTAGNTLWVDSALRKVGINTTTPSGLLQVSVNGTAAAFFINETGNVGIGTANPQSLLSVLKTTYDSDAVGITFGYDPSYYHGISAAFASAAASNRLGFVVNSGTGTRGTVMTLRGDGNVGIGTTAPAATLHVNGSGSSSSGLRITNGTTEVMYVNTTSGNVGIGTTAPNAKLDVNGSARLGNSTNSYVAVSGNGVLTYTGDAQPKRTIVLTASGGTPATTNGATSTQVETTTNKVNYYVLDYDPSTAQYATWQFAVPDSYTGTTVTARFYWQTAGTSGNAIWAVQSAGFANTTAMDSAWGTAASTTSAAGGSANTLIITSEVTLTTGWTAGGAGMIRVYRDAADAADTLTSSARLVVVRLEWTASAESD